MIFHSCIKLFIFELLSLNIYSNSNTQSFFFNNFMNIFQNFNDLWHNNNLFNQFLNYMRNFNNFFNDISCRNWFFRVTLNWFYCFFNIISDISSNINFFFTNNFFLNCFDFNNLWRVRTLNTNYFLFYLFNLLYLCTKYRKLNNKVSELLNNIWFSQNYWNLIGFNLNFSFMNWYIFSTFDFNCFLSSINFTYKFFTKLLNWFHYLFFVCHINWFFNYASLDLMFGFNVRNFVFNNCEFLFNL